MRLIKTVVQDRNLWNDLLAHEFDGHLLQTWQWGQFKERYNWKTSYISWQNSENRTKALALILKRTIASRFSVLYCPRGPILDWSDDELSSQILAELSTYATSEKAIFIKIDPHLVLEKGREGSPEESTDRRGDQVVQKLQSLAWQPSAEQIQFKNTMILNLNYPEEVLLQEMKQKTRYNIRLASRKDVKVRKGGLEDLNLLYQMYAETALRDGFTIRDPAYYQDAWGTFIDSKMAQPFIAEINNHPIAGIIVFRFGSESTYMYGMSRATHREKMPNYLLQWEAIRWAKAMGCKTYDFWGAPDDLLEEDSMWGVYRFKQGFGAKFIPLIGAWDFPTRPTLYRLYTIILPRILEIMRIRGRKQTHQSLDQ